MSKEKKTFYALLILGASLLVLRLPTLFELPGHDQALFSYIGQKIQEGKLLYQDVWDHKPPGIYLLFSWLSLLGSGLHWTIPLTDLLNTLLTMGALFWLAKNCWGLKPALGAAFIFALFSLSPFYQGSWSRIQAEVLINLLLVLGLGGASLGFHQSKNWPWFFSGLALGMAFIIKFTALFFAPSFIPLLVALAPTDPPASRFIIIRKRFFYLTLGWIFPVTAIVLYLYIKGIFPEAYEALIVFNRAYVKTEADTKLFLLIAREKLQEQIFFTSAALLLTFLVLWREKLYRSLLGQVLIIWILGGTLSVYLQGKFLLYHFLFVIPPFSLLAGYSFAWIKKPREITNSRGMFLLVICLITLASGDALRGYLHYYQPGFAFLFKKAGYEQALRSLPPNADKIGSWELGKIIAQNSQENDFILDWWYGPEIYYYSGRSSPHRFIHHQYLMDARHPLAKNFPGLKDRQQNLLHNLKEKPVKFIVVVLDYPNNLPPFIAFQQLKDFPELDRYVQDNYFLVARRERFLYFQRKSMK